MSKSTELLLRDCKEKLEYYRARYGGEYLGGVEFSELMRRIDAHLASQPEAAQEPEWKCTAPPCKCDETNYRKCCYANYLRPAAQEGWRLVPVDLAGEPLYEMWRAINGSISHDHESLKYAWTRTLSAIAAAPQPKGGERE